MFSDKLNVILPFLPDLAGALGLAGTILAVIVYKRFNHPEKYPTYEDNVSGYLIIVALACLSLCIAVIEFHTALKIWRWWFM